MQVTFVTEYESSPVSMSVRYCLEMRMLCLWVWVCLSSVCEFVCMQFVRASFLFVCACIPVCELCACAIYLPCVLISLNVCVYLRFSWPWSRIHPAASSPPEKMPLCMALTCVSIDPPSESDRNPHDRHILTFCLYFADLQSLILGERIL